MKMDINFEIWKRFAFNSVIKLLALVMINFIDVFGDRKSNLNAKTSEISDID